MFRSKPITQRPVVWNILDLKIPEIETETIFEHILVSEMERRQLIKIKLIIVFLPSSQGIHF